MDIISDDIQDADCVYFFDTIDPIEYGLTESFRNYWLVTTADIRTPFWMRGPAGEQLKIPVSDLGIVEH